jgi:hypothetical protein
MNAWMKEWMSVLNQRLQIIGYILLSVGDKWVPVTTAWRVLRLRMEERPADMEGSFECIE